MEPQHILGAIAMVLAVGIAVPQLWVAVVRGRLAGLSWASLTNSALSSWAWVAVALWAADPWLVATSAWYALAYTALSLNQVLRRGSLSDWKLTAPWAVLLAAAIAADVTDLWPPALEVAVVVGAVAWAAPQVGRAWRSTDVSGISASSWAIAAIDASVWLVYAVLVGLGPLLAWAIISLVSAVAIVGRVTVVRWRARRVRLASRTIQLSSQPAITS